MGLQEKIIQLEAKLAQRERETNELMDDYEARLQEQGNGKVDEPKEGHRDIGDFTVFAWSFAQCRVVLLLIWTWVWILLNRTALWKAAPLALLGACLLIVWCSAEIDETGWGRLIIKVIIFGTGCEVGVRWPSVVIPIVCVLALLLATKLTDNLCEWLKSVSVVGKVVGWFL